METVLQRSMCLRGIAGPVRIFSLREAARLRESFYRTAGIDERRPGKSPRSLTQLHWTNDWVWEMATHPGLLDIAEEILGPDIVLWSTHFWYKPYEGQKSVPWHQEGVLYTGMEPVINLTVWVALTESTVENGCLRVVPSQDRSFIGHELLVPGSSRRLDHAVPDRYVDESRVIDMEMTPGEALFFDEGLMHCSGPNQCPDTARIGFSMRLVTPEVRFKMGQWDSSPENVRLFLLRGKDRFNRNPGLHGDPENRHLAAAALRG
jgi:ectoine hydroxylase-related dioxygenase (phytanoyl-CoA dioxygenase family)